MHHIAKILQSHPKPQGVDPERLHEILASVSECALSCLACADACLAEETVDQLRSCISTDQACASVCNALSHLLLQQTAPDKAILKAAAQACESACRRCAKACEMHAQMHAHCAHCAQICRECEAHCRELAGAL